MKISEIKTGRLFWCGLFIGIIVMITGIISLMRPEIGITESRLILCSGLGILFGAFGSTATIKHKGITITGVAGIAIILLYIVVTLTSSQATFGNITGDIKGAQIEVIGDINYLGAIRDRSYEFVVPGTELKRPVFDVYFYFPPNENGEGEQEINLEGINKKYIERVLKSGGHIEWRFNRDRQCLVETLTGELINSTELTAEGLSETSNTGRSPLSFIGIALAQKPPRRIEEIFVDLGSGVASIRRAARDELVSLGPSAVDAMMSKLKEGTSLYRIHLGIIYALNKMLKEDKSRAPVVSKHLSLEDLKIIIEGLNHSDRTLRLYTAEFLNNLGDPRTIDLALSLASNSRSLEDFKLSRFIINGTRYRLSDAQQQETEEKLLRVIKFLNPLKIKTVASPHIVSPGQKTTIIVTVRDTQGNVVPGVKVVISSGGGKFLSRTDLSYDPRARLHGPYSTEGITNMSGEFTTWWVCNPCAAGYILSAKASKEGYLDAKGEIKVNTR